MFMKRVLAFIACCLCAYILHAQVPSWLEGAWERVVHNEDGDFLIRYHFQADGSFSLTNTNLKNRQKLLMKGTILSFSDPTIRLRQDSLFVNDEAFPEKPTDYAWEMQLKQMDRKTLRVIEISQDWLGETHKTIDFFKRPR
jgi:hypothetical protein